jgi:NADH-quinone oxidoreductase subunit G
MACSGGCINGAGQPHSSAATKLSRGRGLYSADGASSIRRSEESTLMTQMYDGILKDREHELLHVSLTGEEHD